MPKLIIIEGPDNTGKNTIINEILEKSEISKVIHCGKPKKSDDVLNEQYITFSKFATIAIIDYLGNSEDSIIFNRYHIGEYVYGQLYRGEESEKILEMINKVEKQILSKIPQDDIYYVQLLSTSSKLLQKNDDNKSLSNAKLELIEKEQELFKIAFEKSIFKNKHIIYINKENSDEFRIREDIISEFNEFIKIK